MWFEDLIFVFINGCNFTRLDFQPFWERGFHELEVGRFGTDLLKNGFKKCSIPRPPLLRVWPCSQYLFFGRQRAEKVKTYQKYPAFFQHFVEAVRRFAAHLGVESQVGWGRWGHSGGWLGT